jgi:hypothetical protein
LPGRDAAQVSVLEAVAVSLQVDDLGVVDEAVDHRGCDYVVAEHLAPAAERFVAGHDETGPFVSGRDQLEEQVGGLGLERDVAHLVDDQQRVAAEFAQFVVQPACLVGVGEPEPRRSALLGALAERTITKTVGEPDQIAAAHLYLMDNRFVTGTVLTVDGGAVLL